MKSRLIKILIAPAARIEALLVVVILCSMFAVTPVRAMAILDIQDGQLIGALNVDVNGTLYDVTFIDGTCVELFGGCDELSDLDFVNYAGAGPAGYALMNQVFIDGPLGDFDTFPELTRGCSSLTACGIFIPYNLVFNGGFNKVSSTVAENDSIRDLPSVVQDHVKAPIYWGIDVSTDTMESLTFAKFSPSEVPVPSTLWLFGLAIAVLSSRSRSIVRF